MTTKYRWSSTSESAELDGTWVALNVEQYTISTFSEVGGFIWARLQQPVDTQELASHVLAEYEVVQDAAHDDIEMFLKQLMDIGLIEQVS